MEVLIGQSDSHLKRIKWTLDDKPYYMEFVYDNHYTTVLKFYIDDTFTQSISPPPQEFSLKNLDTGRISNAVNDTYIILSSCRYMLSYNTKQIMLFDPESM